jgi:uncharacterized protein (DUF885 family)
MKSYRFAASVLLLSLSAATRAAEAPQTRELHALFDEAWEMEMRNDPLRASGMGDRRYDAFWPDISSAAIQKQHAEDVETLARLARINRESLPPPEQLNYDIFEYQYKRRVSAHPFKPWLYELQARDGIQALSLVTEELPFATVADYDNWIARLRSIDRYVDPPQI